MHQIVMRWKLLVVGVSALLGCLASAADLKIQAEAAFVGYGQSQGTLPLAVTLKNSGPDARGALRVSSGDFQMDYPIELPRGTSKRLITYPQLQYADEVSLDLSTNQGNVHGTFRQLLTSDPTAQSVLLIADTQGDLGFLRPSNSTAANSMSPARMWDAYVAPDKAPDRAIAYSGMSIVVLGAGSERISDSVVRALRTYISAGGAVVFMGGASSPVLGDRRWADLLPVRVGLPKTVSKSTFLDNVAERAHVDPLGSSFSVLDCVAVPEAAARKEGGTLILAKRSYGLGRILFMAFNPLEQPFTRWPGRRALFEAVLRPMDSARAMGYADQFSQSSSSNDDMYPSYAYSSSYSSGSGRVIVTPGGTVQQAGGDPFSTKLPPPNKVLLILAMYFVAIIPVNFILLKKLKKGELAWFTAPLISVAFAGAFFAEAKDLYSASLSTATQGLLIATNTGSDTLFVGHSQLFFPQGGEFDLKMEGVDSIGNTQNQREYYGYGRQRDPETLSDVNPADIGHVLIQHMDVSNLAFRELAYQQILPANRWLDVQLVKTATGAILKVTNRSAYIIQGASAVVAGGTFPLRSLGPGETASATIPQTINVTASSDQVPEEYAYRYRGRSAMRYNGLDELTAITKEIVIKGAVQDATVGPRLGKVVASRQNVTLAYFTGLHYGKVEL